MGDNPTYLRFPHQYSLNYRDLLQHPFNLQVTFEEVCVRLRVTQADYHHLYPLKHLGLYTLLVQEHLAL